MTNISVCLYDPKKHRDDVVEIFKSRPAIFTKDKCAQIAEEMKSLPDETHYKIVVENEGKAVGYGGVTFEKPRNLWNLDWLAISHEFQRHGVGSLLMNSIVEWLRSKKINSFIVETCGCDGGISARSFYIKQGFVEIKNVKDGYTKGHSKITYLKQI